MPGEGEIVDVAVDAVDDVIELSKRHQRTLGQLPFEAFRLFAAEGRVLASIVNDEVAAYAIYRVRRRTGVLVLVHLCVDLHHRGAGHAERLVDSVCARHPYSPGLAAWCRSDYPAHRRWPSLGFERTGSRRGRGRDEARLVHWWRPINELTLFTYVADDEGVPIAAMDTNVFRDIVEPRSEFIDSIALAEPWLMDSLRLVVTGHLITEIDEASERSPALRGTISRFPRLPSSADEWRPLYLDLTRVLAETTIEVGDRQQLAQASAGGARYFVTRDSQMISYRDVIEAITGLQVVAPLDLTLALHADQFELNYQAAALRESELEIRHPAALPSKKDLNAFTDHSNREKSSDVRRELALVAGGVSTGARLWELGPADGAPIVVASTSSEGRSLVCHCLRVRADRHRVTFARQLLHLLREEAVEEGHADVEVRGTITDYLEAALVAEGYVENGSSWRARCHLGVIAGHEKVPDADPPARASDLDVSQVSQLERVLWPLKIFGGNAPAYIVPIQPAWARALFDAEPPQGELFQRPSSLGLAREHVYYRSLNRKITAPARLLWWVSGGGSNGGIRAVSWLEAAVAGRPRTLHRQFGSQGIYRQEDVEQVHHSPGGDITALVFSRTEVLRSAIPISHARRVFPAIGGNGYLQSTRQVDEHVFADFYQIGKPLR
jgi:GNAT superfamily N-acetyltransferase